MEIFELLLQVLDRWGAAGLISIAIIYMVIHGSRERGKITSAMSIQTVQASELTKIQEQNAAVSEERWHEKDLRYETIRSETATLINSLQGELRQVTNNNSYGKGVIDTITSTYKEYREQAEADKVAMRAEVDLLKRQVAENKRTIEGLTKSIADKNEHISDLGQKVFSLEKENNTLKLQLANRDKQLATLKEANKKPKVPDNPLDTLPK